MSDPLFDITSMTTEQLEMILAQKKKADQLELELKRKSYEQEREATIEHLGEWAEVVAIEMARLKTDSFNKMGAFRDRLLEYGDLRGGESNKGSFEIKNGRYKISFSTQQIKRFDERAELAEEKLKLFLASFVKKRDKNVYQLIYTLLERDEKTGTFDIDNINRLYKLEDKYDDPNWKDAIRLFKEAYSPTGTAQYVRFSRMTATGAWEPILLDFAKIKPTPNEEEHERTEEL